MHNRDSRRRMRKEDWKYIGKDYGWRLPKAKDAKRYPGTWRTEDHKQDKLKQPYTKTYHNQNGIKKKKENSKGRGLGSKDLIKRELP